LIYTVCYILLRLLVYKKKKSKFTVLKFEDVMEKLQDKHSLYILCTLKEKGDPL